jgi:hypothetical protein
MVDLVSSISYGESYAVRRLNTIQYHGNIPEIAGNSAHRLGLPVDQQRDSPFADQVFAHGWPSPFGRRRRRRSRHRRRRCRLRQRAQQQKFAARCHCLQPGAQNGSLIRVVNVLRLGVHLDAAHHTLDLKKDDASDYMIGTSHFEYIGSDCIVNNP